MRHGFGFVIQGVVVCLVVGYGAVLGLRFPASKTIVDAEANEQIVQFRDEQLEKVIRLAIAKPSGDIYQTDLLALTQLDASGKGICVLNGLEYCTNLAAVDLSNNVIADITPLSGLLSLTNINLANNGIFSARALAGLPNLATLDFSNNNLSDITPLAGLTTLTELNLAENTLGSIEAIANLLQLRKLNLSGHRCCPQPLNISVITPLHLLEELNLANNTLADIQPLSQFTQLVKLDISYMRATSLAPLSSLTGLVSLNVGGNPLCGDLSPLETLPALHDLGLSDMDLTDTSYFQELGTFLPNLEELNLANNSLVNLNGLEGFSVLEHLTLDDNPLYNIAALSGMTHLCWISMLRCQVNNFSPLVANLNFGAGCYLGLYSYCCDYSSIYDLMDRGVTVYEAEYYEGVPEGMCEGEPCQWYYGAYDSCTLSGIQAVPSNTSPATGSATMIILYNDCPICSTTPSPEPHIGFSLQHTVAKPTGVQIRQGNPWENGPVVLDFGPIGRNEYCSLPCWPFVEDGPYYIVIQSSTYPNGEIRGQLQPCMLLECEYGYSCSTLCPLPNIRHTGDQDGDHAVGLPELLRVIQFYNSDGLHCESGTEDGYAPGLGGDTSCVRHASDYAPHDWRIDVSELLRFIQFYNMGAYYQCEPGEDGFCPGTKD